MVVLMLWLKYIDFCLMVMDLINWMVINFCLVVIFLQSIIRNVQIYPLSLIRWSITTMKLTSDLDQDCSVTLKDRYLLLNKIKSSNLILFVTSCFMTMVGLLLWQLQWSDTCEDVSDWFKCCEFGSLKPLDCWVGYRW